MLGMRQQDICDRRHHLSSEPLAPAPVVSGDLVVHEPENGTERPQPPASPRTGQLPDGLALPAQAPERHGASTSGTTWRSRRGGRNTRRGTQEGRCWKSAGIPCSGRYCRRNPQERHGADTPSAHPCRHEKRAHWVHPSDGGRRQHGGHGRLACVRGTGAPLCAPAARDRGIDRHCLSGAAAGASDRIPTQALASWDSPGPRFARTFGRLPGRVRVPLQPPEFTPQRAAILPTPPAGLQRSAVAVQPSGQNRLHRLHTETTRILRR